MDNSWVSVLDSTFYTIVGTKLKNKFLPTYPDLYITKTLGNLPENKFPTVYIHALPFSEMMNDLDGTSINAVNASYQIDVYSNKSQNDTNKVMAEIINIVKSMRFSVNAFPEVSLDGSVHRAVMRCNRLIGSGDTL